MSEAPSEATDDKPKRHKMPAAEAPAEASDDAKKADADVIVDSGNASIEFTETGVPIELGGDVKVVSSSGEVRLCRFNVTIPKVPSDGLSVGVFGAASELAAAAEFVGDGTNSHTITSKRDYRTATYTINPDGSGQGIEFVGSVRGSIKTHIEAKGKVSASWQIEAKLYREQFDRLLDLKRGMITMLVTPIQVELVEGDAGQLEIH